jgi:hypothetical protein
MTKTMNVQMVKPDYFTDEELRNLHDDPQVARQMLMKVYEKSQTRNTNDRSWWYDKLSPEDKALHDRTDAILAEHGIQSAYGIA